MVSRKSLEIAILSALWAFSLLGLLGGHVLISYGLSDSPIISGVAWKITLILAFLYTMGRFVRSCYLRSFAGSAFSNPWPFFLILAIYLFTDLPQRKFSFYADRSLLVDLLMLGSVLLIVFRFGLLGGRGFSKVRAIFSLRNLVFLQCLLSVFYLYMVDGRVLYSDDHPSFMYRLYLLKEHFPHLPFYNTDWNAGYNAREFFPSGMLNIFLLLSPFIYAFASFDSLQAVSWYSFVPFFIIGIFAPWLTYAAARLYRLPRDSAVCAALLVLYPATMAFEWPFKYGTLGFATSAVFVPLAFALAFRLVMDKRAPDWMHVGMLLLVSFCVVTWSLSCFIFVPFTLFALVHFRGVFARDRRVKVIVFIGAFLAINIPWMYTFVNESRVFDFVSRSSLPGTHKTETDETEIHETVVILQNDEQQVVSTQKSESKNPHVSKVGRAGHVLGKLRESLGKIDPLLFFLILPSLVFFSALSGKGLSGKGLSGDRLYNGRRREGLIFAITLVWLLSLAVIGEEFKPQLELKRMLVVASYLMCIPVSHLLVSILRCLFFSVRERVAGHIVSYRARQLLGVFYSIVILGTLGFGPIKFAQGLLMRTYDKYRFADESVEQLIEGIKANAGTGRTFFSGFILHELNSSSHDAEDGGHIAPLAMFTGHELYASDFYHAKWSSVDPIPQVYLDRGENGIEEFLDLINATLVVAHLKEWKDYFLKTPGYKEVAQAGLFKLFARERANGSYILKGNGSVERINSGLEIRMKSQELIIKYRYQPHLRLSKADGVELFAVPVFVEGLGAGNKAQVSYIGLRLSSDALRLAGDEGVLVDVSYYTPHR